MKTIKENINNTLIINKSKFITYLYKVSTLKEIDSYLNNTRRDYKDASHICYAYSIKQYQKMSDDKEPIGCAGKPMMEVLIKKNLTNVLAVVVRYFGGIKLGSNGLIRAYRNSLTQCLLKGEIIDLTLKYHIIIQENYRKQKLIEQIIKNDIIIQKDFHEQIIYDVIVKKETLDNLSNISYKIIESKEM